MLRFFSIDQGVITQIEPAPDTPLATSIKNAHWIDTINPTGEERRALHVAHGAPPGQGVKSWADGEDANDNADGMVAALQQQIQQLFT